MSKRTADDTDDQREIVGDWHRIADMLPPPDQLVLREDTVKVALVLSRRSVACVLREAAKQRISA